MTFLAEFDKNCPSQPGLISSHTELLILFNGRVESHGKNMKIPSKMLVLICGTWCTSTMEAPKKNGDAFFNLKDVVPPTSVDVEA